MAQCNYDQCSTEATTVVAEVYTTGGGQFMDIAGGVFCDGHRPPCVTGTREDGFLLNCGRPHLTHPIAEKNLGFVTIHDPRE